MVKVMERIEPRHILHACRELGIHSTVLASALGVNPRTIERWEEEVASPNEAATRLLEKLEDIQKMMNRLLKKEAREKWLHTPNPTLGGVTPIDILTRGEIERVKNLLAMLEWGIYS